MIYEKFKNKSQAKLAVLIDPDKQYGKGLEELVLLALNSRTDFFFVGGSLLSNNHFNSVIQTLKKLSDIPVVIFPGNSYQVSDSADAILFLSLISGRNAEFLIGQQVVAAPLIKQAGLEAIPTGYILIDGGRVSTTAYITQTMPIPNDRPAVAATTAIAGEMLGMKMIYLEAGSGALTTVEPQLIAAVKKTISVPLIVGGGIRTADDAEEAVKAGADVVVIGNVLEKEPQLLMEISLAVHSTVTQ
jgi:putative glycerol-1-phosphate prenyltransferase